MADRLLQAQIVVWWYSLVVDALLAAEMFISNFSIGWLMAADYGKVDGLFGRLTYCQYFCRVNPFAAKNSLPNKPFMLTIGPNLRLNRTLGENLIGNSKENLAKSPL